MPVYDVSIYLSGGITVRITLADENQKAVDDRIQKQIAGKDRFSLLSDTKKGFLTVQKPENVIGYFINEV